MKADQGTFSNVEIEEVDKEKKQVKMGGDWYEVSEKTAQYFDRIKVGKAEKASVMGGKIVYLKMEGFGGGSKGRGYEMSKEDWIQKETRTSRSVCLSYCVTLVTEGKMEMDNIYSVANQMSKFVMDGTMPVVEEKIKEEKVK